jgi:hypothetical protein
VLDVVLDACELAVCGSGISIPLVVPLSFFAQAASVRRANVSAMRVMRSSGTGRVYRVAPEHRASMHLSCQSMSISYHRQRSDRSGGTVVAS